MLGTLRKTILKILPLLAALTFHAKGTEFVVKEGIWEGIYKPYNEYRILNVEADGQFTFLQIKLAGTLSVKKYKFNREQVTCSIVSCVAPIKIDRRHFQIRMNQGSLGGEDELNVLETPFHDDGKPIATYSYALKRSIKNKTAFKSFIERFSKKFELLNESNDYELGGLWIGTIETEGNIDLFVLDGSDKDKSHFIRYTLGTGLVIEDTFLPSEVFSTDDELKIEAQGSLFAKKIIMHKNYDNRLSGYFYSYHNNYLIRQGTFSAIRLSPQK